MDFDEMKKQAENAAAEHPDQVDSAIDLGAGMAEEKVGHADQVDKGAGKLKSFFRRK